jgi:hypothetical protein
MKSGTVPLPAALQASAFTAAYEAGADAVVLWDCAKFSPRAAGAGAKSVMNGVVGPLARRLLTAACGCAAAECSGRGRCRELKAGAAAGPAVAGGGCVCDQGYAGASCNVSALAMIVDTPTAITVEPVARKSALSFVGCVNASKPADEDASGAPARTKTPAKMDDGVRPPARTCALQPSVKVFPCHGNPSEEACAKADCCWHTRHASGNRSNSDATPRCWKPNCAATTSQAYCEAAGPKPNLDCHWCDNSHAHMNSTCQSTKDPCPSLTDCSSCTFLAMCAAADNPGDCHWCDTTRSCLSRFANCSKTTLESGGKPRTIMTVLIDDLGWADTQIRNPFSPTPHIGQLAYEGINLLQHHVYRYCSPTRRSILSGRFPVHIWGTQAPVCSNYLPLQFTLLPAKLKRAGFEAHMIGKGSP